MDMILDEIDKALRIKGLSDAAASKLAVGHSSLIKNFRMERKGEKRYNLAALVKLAEVLDLEMYFGPARPRENLSGFAEAAVSRIEQTMDGSPEALRMGFLPLPFSFYDPTHRGVSPLAFARAWLLEHSLEPEHLSIISMPSDDMAPSISPGELLLVDDSRKLAEEPDLAAFLFDGCLGVGWAMAPIKGAVVVLFERRFSPPIVLSEGSTSRYRHLGGIAARFDSLPSPWLSQQDKHAALERGRDLVSKR